MPAVRLEPTRPALAVLMVSALAVLPAFAEPMTPEQITRQIVGKELVTRRKGMTVHLRYDLQGSVTVSTPLFSQTGTWTHADDGLCMTLSTGLRQGETCHTFEDLGNGRYRNSEGLILRVLE